VPVFVSSVEVAYGGNTLHLKTARLRLDGVMVEVGTAVGLAGSEAGVPEPGAQLIVKFTYDNERYAIHGKSYDASLISTTRLSVDRYHIFLRFTNLSKTEKMEIRGMIRDLSRLRPLHSK